MSHNNRINLTIKYVVSLCYTAGKMTHNVMRFTQKLNCEVL